MRKVWLAFFAIGIAFITIGLNGRRTFIFVGLAFFAIAVIRLLRDANR